jgi:hypothetical protein
VLPSADETAREEAPEAVKGTNEPRVDASIATISPAACIRIDERPSEFSTWRPEWRVEDNEWSMGRTIASSCDLGGLTERGHRKANPCQMSSIT